MAFDMLFFIVQKIQERPGDFFGRNEYNFREVIAYLNGYVVATNIYANIDKRYFDSKVKNELAKKFELDPNKHILDMFDLVCENEQEKTNLYSRF